MWNIYNKQYDLTSFIKDHPGGKDILIKTKGEKDITALFETYHAFSNIKYIKEKLNKYEIVSTESKEANMTYDFTNYHKLVDKVKNHFPNRKNIKANTFWIIWNSVIFLLYIYSFYISMLSDYSIGIRTFFGFVAGSTYISLGFNIMHDASHYAVSLHPQINLFLARIWNSWGLWNSNIWFYHHVYNHHSFTGQENKDPDLYHLRPFIRKIKSDNKIYRFLLNIQDRIAPFILFIFPGQYIGQIISYLLSSFKFRIFKINLPKIFFYEKMDALFAILHIFFLYKGLYLPTMSYILALNFCYSINIIPDHDTYESAIDNHYSGNDWCKMQICNSGNFVNDNLLWTYLFGGINYQIEHHLFPNISHIYYPKISKIVKKYCLENNIPYVNHPTILGAYKSFIKQIKFNKQ